MNLFLRSIVFFVAASAIVDVFCPTGRLLDRIANESMVNAFMVGRRTTCPNPHAQCDGTEDEVIVWNHVMRILSEVYVATAPGHEYVTRLGLLVGGGVQEINVLVNPDFKIQKVADSTVRAELRKLADAPDFNYVTIFTPNEAEARRGWVSVMYTFPYLIRDEETLAGYRLGAPARGAVAAPARRDDIERDDRAVDAERRADWDAVGLRQRAPQAPMAPLRADVVADEPEVENAYGCPSCSIL